MFYIKRVQSISQVWVYCDTTGGPLCSCFITCYPRWRHKRKMGWKNPHLLGSEYWCIWSSSFCITDGRVHDEKEENSIQATHSQHPKSDYNVFVLYADCSPISGLSKTLAQLYDLQGLCSTPIIFRLDRTDNKILNNTHEILVQFVAL